MNLDRCLLFSWIEEDNIQKAYFRVRPLLTFEGDIRAEAEQLWPAEGCLRIVPDRNEQHTFKGRMRSLGNYCVVDLRGLPADAGKIRTNKNFRPEKGEVNQYIIYSDTVKSLPENFFYQIVEGTAEDYSAAALKAVTPCFFIRQGDTLYGPVRKEVPEKPEPASEAAGTLFELPCPDGEVRLILCMDDAPKAQPAATKPAAVPAPEKTAPAQPSAAAEAPVTEKPAPAAEEAPLPIGQTLQILDQSKGFEETLQTLDKPVSRDANLLRQQPSRPIKPPSAPAPAKATPLGGTHLVSTPMRASVPQPKNRVQEIVNNHMVGYYEPPTENLPANTPMRSVQNPVEIACASLRQAWHATDAHPQLLDCILSLDGFRSKLEARLCGDSGTTLLQQVLRDRLQDLEAERLTALCELDRAHRDVDAYKDELVNALKVRITREAGQLQSDRADCEARVNELKSEINALSAQRDALTARVDELQGDVLPAALARQLADAQMLAPTSGSALRMAPISGELIAPDELIERLLAVCTASGLALPRNQAIALLVLLAMAPRFGVVCPNAAPLATLVKNIAAAFGWTDSVAHQVSPEQRPVIAARPVDSTPAILMTSLPSYTVHSGVSKVLLSRNTPGVIRNAAFDADQWPVMVLPALPFVDEVIPEEPSAPVSAASLTALLDKACVKDEELKAVLAPVLQAAAPLSGASRKAMFRFVSVCAGLMEGGLPAAADWAILLWLIPAADHANAPLKALLDEYPLSQNAL